MALSCVSRTASGVSDTVSSLGASRSNLHDRPMLVIFKAVLKTADYNRPQGFL